MTMMITSVQWRVFPATEMILSGQDDSSSSSSSDSDSGQDDDMIDVETKIKDSLQGHRLATALFLLFVLVVVVVVRTL